MKNSEVVSSEVVKKKGRLGQTVAALKGHIDTMADKLTPEERKMFYEAEARIKAEYVKEKFGL